MKLVFVHGWSATSIKTYGQLPEVLKKNSPNELNIEIENIYLGEYISFHDEVTLFDIARAFESARLKQLGNEPFSCITHSTGAPVMRLWLDLFYKNNLENLPLNHLIMLAPANHGSALAILGKGKLSRIKAWVQGIEPGVGILNWLQLGSSYQWDLNCSWMDYTIGNDFFPVVLSGEKIDTKFYDYLNDYLVEKGSDGVIRLSSANLNYQKLTLRQDCSKDELDIHVNSEIKKAYPLVLQNEIRCPRPTAFEVISNASHTGNKHGIMYSIKKNRVVKPVIYSIIQSLQITSSNQYNQLIENMQERTQEVQKNKDRYLMFVFNVHDNYGNKIKDYDMLLLAGNQYEPHKLPKKFFIDRQKNDSSGNLVYYINYDKLKKIKDNKLGIRITARPSKGFSHYCLAEFRSEETNLPEFLYPNETVMVDVVLERRIDENTFVLERVEDSVVDFRGREKSEGFI